MYIKKVSVFAGYDQNLSLDFFITFANPVVKTLKIGCTHYQYLWLFSE